MKYAIVINPVSGEISPERKLELLQDASRILKAPLFGFDTGNVTEFTEMSKDLATEFDVLVVAGGDGTFSEVINAVDISNVILAYMPLGSGNALKSALGYSGTLSEVAIRIKDGKVYNYDLIECSGKKLAFMVSVGIEGVIVKLRERYRQAGLKGIHSYIIPTLDAYFWRYKRTSALLKFGDGRALNVDDLVTIMIMKQPYFGYGMNVVPDARFDDGLLHIMCINSSFAELLFGALSSFTGGNMIGDYYVGEEVSIEFERPMEIQIDGNVGWNSKSFEFFVKKACLKLKH